MSLILDYIDAAKYSTKEKIRDCMNDPTEWINMSKEWKRDPSRKNDEHELKLLLDKYKGLPLAEIIVNETNPHLIKNIGIKKCKMYPTKKCAFIKPFFCKDKYDSNKDEDELLDSSFFGILDHDFYETRRRNNPFARRNSSYSHRITRKVPFRSSSSVPMLRNTTRKSYRKKEQELDDLIQNIKTMMLESQSSTAIRNRSRSRARSRPSNIPLSQFSHRTRSKTPRK